MKVKVDIITSDDIKIYYTGKFQDFTARCVIKLIKAINQSINSSLIEKNLEVTKLKAFADDKLDIIKMVISLFGRVENAVGKEENAG